MSDLAERRRRFVRLLLSPDFPDPGAATSSAAMLSAE